MDRLRKRRRRRLPRQARRGPAPPIRRRSGARSGSPRPEDAGRLRDALGVSVPMACRLHRPVGAAGRPRPAFARTWAFLAPGGGVARLAVDPCGVVLEALDRRKAPGASSGPTGWSGVVRPDVLRQLRRRCLAVLRRDRARGGVPPWPACPPGRAWGCAPGGDALAEVVGLLRGRRCPPRCSRPTSPFRMAAYRPPTSTPSPPPAPSCGSGAGADEHDRRARAPLFRDQVPACRPRSTDGRAPPPPPRALRPPRQRGVVLADSSAPQLRAAGSTPTAPCSMRCGTSSGRAGHQRLVRPAPCPGGGAVGAGSAKRGSPGQLAGGQLSPPAAGHWSPGGAAAHRGGPRPGKPVARPLRRPHREAALGEVPRAGSPASTRCSRPSGAAGAARLTSWPASAPPSSPARAVDRLRSSVRPPPEALGVPTGAAAATRRRWSSRPPAPPSLRRRPAPAGHRGAAVPAVGPAPSWCWSTARLPLFLEAGWCTLRAVPNDRRRCRRGLGRRLTRLGEGTATCARSSSPGRRAPKPSSPVARRAAPGRLSGRLPGPGLPCLR